MSYDFRDLAKSLVNNGQYHLPPNDIMRQGVVVGYDPNYVSSAGAHDYPMLSIQIAGDEAPCHGFRFSENYIPNLGDTVWVVMSGEDAWVLGSLAGSPKTNMVTAQSPNGLIRSSSGIVGHGVFVDTTSTSTSTSTALSLVRTALVTPILPNRLYKVDLSATFTVSNVVDTDTFTATWTNNSTTITTSGTQIPSTAIGSAVIGVGIAGGTVITAVNGATVTISQATTSAQSSATKIGVTVTHTLSLGIITPTGYQEVATGRIHNGSNTLSGSTTWFNTNHTGSYPNNWKATYPNAQFTWKVGLMNITTGATPATVVGVSQRVVVHDLGVAS